LDPGLRWGARQGAALAASGLSDRVAERRLREAAPVRQLQASAGGHRADSVGDSRQLLSAGEAAGGGPSGVGAGAVAPAASGGAAGADPLSRGSTQVPIGLRGRRIFCTVPTYNEVLNIVDLCRALIALGPEVEVLVIDDNSPDGTARAVAELAQSEPRVHLLLRTTDKGRGRAGRAGFVRALEMGAEVVVEMDADFSHHPRFIPALLERLSKSPQLTRRGQSIQPYGLVLGSRAVSGGSDADRGWLRQQVTRLANLYIRILLGVPVKDCNSGFRCWRAETLRAIQVENTFSVGPAIVQELLYKTARAKIPISEVGIEFIDRVRGESTLTLKILMQGYTTVLKLRWMALWGKL
jgi:dolichol-phosphate mannosyltransferase